MDKEYTQLDDPRRRVSGQGEGQETPENLDEKTIGRSFVGGSEGWLD